MPINGQSFQTFDLYKSIPKASTQEERSLTAAKASLEIDFKSWVNRSLCLKYASFG